MSLVSVAPTSSQLTVCGSLQFGQVSFDLTPLIDSGSGHNFIQRNFVEKNNIPIQDVEVPFAVSLANGQPFLVNKETQLLFFQIENHREAISFFVIDILPEAILGFPWLSKHQPTIAWSENSVSFHSELCLKTCLIKKISICMVQPTSLELEPTDQLFCCSILPANDNSEISSLPFELQKFSDVFNEENSMVLPPSRSYDHQIHLKQDAKPPYGPIYALSQDETQALRKYIEENLDKGFINPSNSSVASPVLFVKKKDGSLRLCVDFRKVNALSHPNRYPLPLIGEMLKDVRGAKFFTKLDLRGAYNLIRMHPDSEYLTAFRTKFGLYEYKVMPFGLQNAPATFQQYMNEQFRTLIGKCVLIYLDDILIYSPNHKQHVKDCTDVLNILQKESLFAKAEKCEFFKTSVEFLGFVLDGKGLAMSPNKVSAVKHWSKPTTLKGLQSFLGFCNFYRRFVQDYSAVVSPLTKLTRKNTPFNWDTPQDTAFNLLKTKLTEMPVLRHHDPNKKAIIETDASDSACGAVLSQDFDGTSHPIGYYSKKFTGAEINYPIHDKELLAIIRALQFWRPEVQSTKDAVLIITDHRNLEYFLTTKTLNRRQAHWWEILSEYNFHIKYRPGIHNGAADALSRKHPPDHDENQQTLLTTDHFLGAMFVLEQPQTELLHQILEAQAKDTVLLGAKEKYPAKYTTDKQKCILYQGKIAVPRNNKVKLEVVKYHHDLLAAHGGRQKTTELIQRNYHWPGMSRFIGSYVKSCTTCAKNKTSTQAPAGLLNPLSVPTAPWRSISVDFVVKLPISQGFDSIMVVVDRLTKMSHFVPCIEAQSSEDVATLFYNNIFRLHGLPEDITSDRDTRFICSFWTTFTSLLRIKRNLSTSYRPQTDGQTERTNQTMEAYLRALTSAYPSAWTSALPQAEFAYNNSRHSAIGMSPFKATYGYDPNMGFPSTTESSVPSASNSVNKLIDLHKSCQQKMADSQETAKKYYDKRHSDAPDYYLGQQVYLRNKNLGKGASSGKFAPKYLGPFQIIDKISPLAFKLRLPDTLKNIHDVFHASLLKPIHETEDLQRTQATSNSPEINVQPPTNIKYDQILAERKSYDDKEYLVHMENTHPSENKYVHWKEVFNNNRDLLNRYMGIVRDEQL